MTNSEYTHLHVVVDRSASMHADNKYVALSEEMTNLIKEQIDLPGKFTYSITEFNQEISHPVVFTEIFVPYTLVPRGNTALLDAVGGDVASLGERLSKMPEENRPGLVIFMIVTDGEENASKEYTIDQVREMIQHQQEVYGWDFMFLGAEEAAWAGRDMGIMNVSSFTNDSHGTRAVYGASLTYITDKRTTGEASLPDQV